MSFTFSVVIPTYNRLQTLIQVLKSLENQVDSPEFEVIVVNDGSTDETNNWLNNKIKEYSRPLKIFNQENCGPATARNLGIKSAEGLIIALLGDDTIPSERWLCEHYRAHETRGNPEKLAVIGYTKWHTDIRQTRFLRFINETGPQFGFSIINDPEDVPYNFFYTSNISVPRKLFDIELFRTGFKYPAWEDIELGFRLVRGGMKMVYASDAIVEHNHHTDLKSFFIRQKKVGISAMVFYKMHPELVKSDFGIDPENLSPSAAGFVPWAVEVFARLLEPFPVDIPRTWNWLLRNYFVEGLHLAIKDMKADLV
ncbi:MAG: glycosyltransferase family 2 protein [Candidatus Theseobacter exili]|nr:glycosyltransferase family 2 protein [Candidatus Theseobacter exili]